MKSISSNKKAYFDYEVSDNQEAGILLYGWEVKSIKAGRFSLAGSYIINRNGELFLLNSSVPLWSASFVKNTELQNRERKLLLNKSEIRSIVQKAKEKGNTIIPLEAYINDRGLIKIQIGLAKGKKKYDKRLRLKEKDMKKRIEGERRRYNF